MADSTHDTDSGQVAADLRAAADVLERDGWTQGNYHSANIDLGAICHCAQGAIAYAVTGDPWSVPDVMVLDNAAEGARYDAAEGALSKLLGEATDEWNDADDREQEQVIAALRAAADRAEAKS